MKVLEKIAEKLKSEIVPLLSELIKFKTESPPSHTRDMAEFIQKYLKNYGIEMELQAAGCTEMVNGIALLEGKSEKPIMAMHSHLDVVTALNESQWKYPPYSGHEKCGYIWGRGAIDMKGYLAVQMLTLVALKEAGENLYCNPALLLTADEERGGITATRMLVEENEELLKKVKCVISEGGYIYSDGNTRIALVSLAEKKSYPLTIRILSGKSGHAALQEDDNNNVIFAIPKLLEKIKKFNDSQNKLELFSNSSLYSLDSYKDLPFYKNGLKNTITPTKLNSGLKGNLIPDALELRLDCRLTPYQNEKEFVKLLSDYLQFKGFNVIVDDKHPACSALPKKPSISQDFKTIENIILNSLGINTVPICAPFMTDLQYFREKGITSYGFMPFCFDKEVFNLYHNFDERIGTNILKEGLLLNIKLIYEACHSTY